jgi:hypothetical protein
VLVKAGTTIPAPLFAVKQIRGNFMIVLAMLVFLWMPYLITRLLRTAALPRAEPPRPAHSDSPSQDGQSWSALDDRQLTRLLMDSAPPTTSEQDLT